MRYCLKIGAIAVALTLVSNAYAVKVKDYQKEIHKAGVVVVNFWAPWCGNCSAFEPAYNRAKKRFGKSVRFIEVNVDRVDNVESAFGLKYGLPTLTLFKNGKETSKLPGGGETSEVVEWINRYR